MNILKSVGIDVGKTELVASIRNSDGKMAIPAPFPKTIMGVRKLIVHLRKHNIGNNEPILLESTGPYHWQAARSLTDKGYFVKVANPLHTKHIARHSIRKQKTDKVDAGHLAFLASQNYGYRFMETKEMARKKALARHCFKLRQIATRLTLRERYLKEYRGIGQYTASAAVLKVCETAKKALIKEWLSGNELKYVDSIPVVSPFLGAVILSELLPLEQFTRMDQIIAFAGLDPSVKQSGGKPDKHGRISKRGSPVLRLALFLAAFGSFSKKPTNLFCLRYKERGLHHNAILCILARKILRIAVALLKKRQCLIRCFLSDQESRFFSC